MIPLTPMKKGNLGIGSESFLFRKGSSELRENPSFVAILSLTVLDEHRNKANGSLHFSDGLSFMHADETQTKLSIKLETGGSR